MKALHRPLASLAFIAIGLASLFITPPKAHAEANVLFIFDASGSMKTLLNGRQRIDIAKQSLMQSVLAMPETARLGLMIFGARRARDCRDIHLVSPIGAEIKGMLIVAMAGLEAKGETPIAESIIQGAKNFTALKGQNNHIVLLTDGIEECRGDPCAAAIAVKNMGVNLKINIVGFTLNAKQRESIECLANETGGKYFEAADAPSLVIALSEVTQKVVAAPVAPAPRQPPSEAQKPKPDHLLKVSVLLGPGAPYSGVEGVKWDLFRASAGVRESTPLITTSTLSDTFLDSPKPGQYVLRARVGLASGESGIEVKPDEKTEATIVLNAGLIAARAISGSQKPMPSDTARRVRWDVVSSSGTNAGTYSSEYQIVVPAGRSTVQARVGNADSKVTVDVSVGAMVPVEIALGVGRLVLRAKAVGGTKNLAGVQWQVANAASAQVVFGESYFTESVYNLLAGEYKITAKIGNAVVLENVTIPVGEVVVKEVVVAGMQ